MATGVAISVNYEAQFSVSVTWKRPRGFSSDVYRSTPLKAGNVKSGGGWVGATTW